MNIFEDIWSLQLDLQARISVQVTRQQDQGQGVKKARSRLLPATCTLRGSAPHPEGTHQSASHCGCQLGGALGDPDQPAAPGLELPAVQANLSSPEEC